MRIFSYLVCSAFIAIYSSTNVHACSCITGSSTCASFKSTAVVFVGRVVTIEESKTTIQRFGKSEEIRTGLLAHFEVERPYKGIPLNQVNVDVVTGGGGGDCGYDFKPGQQYIVFAYGDALQNKAVATSICSRTQSLPDGQNDVDLIEAFLQGKPEGRISGTVGLYGRELGAGPLDMNRKGPAAGVKIEAHTGTNTLTTVTDENGRFQFRNVSDGKYEIHPILAPTQSGYLGFDQTSKVEIRLPELCGSDTQLLIQTNGIIGGRLLDSEGKPVPRNVEVSILTAESALKGPSSFVGSSTWTKDGGTYKFDGLLPGDYVIAAGGLHPPDWRSPYVRIYYPSTARIAEAHIFHLSEGEKFTDVDIHLPSAMPTVAVWGLVFNSDGTPAVYAQIELFDVDFGMAAEKPEVLFKTGADGAFTVTGLKDRHYQVRAYRTDDFFAGTGIQSEPVEITASDNLKSIILVLNKPGIYRKDQK